MYFGVGGQVCIAAYGATSQVSVRTAVKATLTQLLSALVEKLREKEALRVRLGVVLC